MQILLNDKPTELPDDATVSDLLKSLDLWGKFVAVERNRGVVPYQTYDQTKLNDGDVLEVVTLVGGG